VAERRLFSDRRRIRSGDAVSIFVSDRGDSDGAVDGGGSATARELWRTPVSSHAQELVASRGDAISRV
jgi:hypothetical protein